MYLGLAIRQGAVPSKERFLSLVYHVRHQVPCHRQGSSIGWFLLTLLQRGFLHGTGDELDDLQDLFYLGMST